MVERESEVGLELFPQAVARANGRLHCLGGAEARPAGCAHTL